MVVAGVSRIWVTGSPQDQDALANRAIALVMTAQTQTVRLTDAYMTQKTRRATGKGAAGRIKPEDYTIDKLRGVPALEVYKRPFGALGAALARGEEFSEALRSGRASLVKVASTDIQLAQVRAARDWMVTEPKITAMGRLVAGTCDYCKRASAELVGVEDPMPIHEHCQCSAVPMFGEEPTGSVETEKDSELGMRLPTVGKVAAAKKTYTYSIFSRKGEPLGEVRNMVSGEAARRQWVEDFGRTLGYGMRQITAQRSLEAE